MITKRLAEWLSDSRATLHHVTVKNRDGSPARCRVNGKIKTWKRPPFRWLLPVKHGLRYCFYISESNGFEWNIYLNDDEMIAELSRIAGLPDTTEPGIIRDKLIDDGKYFLAALLDKFTLSLYAIPEDMR